MDADLAAAATLVVRVDAGDVGHRVVLRRRLPAGGFGDVLGVLLGWSGGLLTVATRHGQVEVAEADLAAGKRVPPPPAPRRRR